MALFNRIGDLSKRENQFKMFKMLMHMGVNRPNEMTSVCITVVTAMALIHELPRKKFQMISDDMLEKYDEMQNDSEVHELFRIWGIHEK